MAHETDSTGSATRVEVEIEPLYTLADLEHARSEARAAGMLAAQAGADLRLRAEAMTTLDCIRLLLQDCRNDASIHLDQTSEAIAQLLFATLAALLPGLCATHHAQEIMLLVRTLVSGMHREPTLCVSVHPSMVEDLRRTLCLSLEPEKGQMALAADERLSAGDARIVWDRGTATYNSRKALNAVNAVLNQLGLGSSAARPASPAPLTGTASIALETKQDRLEHANG